ncbi:heme-binding protein 2-like [Carcharodon carcharias]|uniref:heme-binding protein 2-like n=1 Tax=Carcharodon carcharias TaxID=13397 RepID=UPI001B7DC06C|nr:heme-binding protein 2-like [Carcharodon carcharias]
MLRLFLTVSVLSWQQLAAQDEVENFCYENDCIEPAEVIVDKNYEEKKFLHLQAVQTVVTGVDMNRAIETGLEKLFNYSHFSNAAGTIVPISAPWGVFESIENGTMEQTFIIYVLIVAEVITPPEPTDQTVQLESRSFDWYYVRVFDQKVDEQQYEKLVTEFRQDLEQDNQHFDPRFSISFYSTHGLMQIAFRKIVNPLG